LQRIDRLLQVVADVLSLFRPFEQNGQVVELADERVSQIDFFAQAAAALQRLLGFNLIGPEIGGGNTLFDCRKLSGRVGGVKDSSAGLWRV
jgi:hypothetical protein